MTASPPRENLFRSVRGINVRDAETDKPPTLTGHFAVFNQWTEINSVYEGHFLERFAPGAFDKTLSDNRDGIRVLFQHGQDPQIGDKVLGSIDELEADTYGVRYSVPLFDTSYNRDLIPGIKAGQYGASFRFRAMQQQFVERPKRTDTNPDGIPERTVTEARVFEFGPVTFPAYAGASAQMRSMTDEFLLGRLLDDPDRLSEMLEEYKKRSLERAALEPDPSEGTTPETDRAPAESEPPEATTQPSSRGLFWFADTPKHLKDA